MEKNIHLENFEKLYNSPLEGKTETLRKSGVSLTYVSWSCAWLEFKRAYPDATYTIQKDEQGRAYFGDEDIGYMVYTSLTGGGLTHDMWLPVTNSANKTLKRQPYTIKTKTSTINIDGMTMFDVNTAIMRCLAKNIAMFGFGLTLYQKIDAPFEREPDPIFCVDCNKTIESLDIAQRTEIAFGRKLCTACGKKAAAPKKLIKNEEGNTDD